MLMSIAAHSEIRFGMSVVVMVMMMVTTTTIMTVHSQSHMHSSAGSQRVWMTPTMSRPMIAVLTEMSLLVTLMGLVMMAGTHEGMVTMTEDSVAWSDSCLGML